MRLWSIHPGYLDAKGLVALWREGLLAQNVLRGKTKGYRRHPQIVRFKSTCDPVGAVARYLDAVAEEASLRGYRFDDTKIAKARFNGKIAVTDGQIRYEFMHLLKKLHVRDPLRFQKYKDLKKIRPHPLFTVASGGIETWEKV